MNAKIIFNNVSKVFISKKKKVVRALARISFTVAHGEFLSIIGPSGCGKSTIINLAAGFILPERGEVLIDGKLAEKPDFTRTVVFQENGLFPWKTVRDNIEFGLKCKGINKKERQIISQKLVERVQLTGFEKYFPYELSSGMKQRAALARALVVKPEIILMDEPFASLDQLTREFLQEKLLQLHGELKQTIIFVTHNIEEAIFLSDRIIILSDRPAKVKEIVNISILKPRIPEVRHSSEFIALKVKIWQSLKE